MVSPEFIREMARYNEWQNKQLQDAMSGLNEEVLRQERGAFFGSIFATANHVLWADRLWMSRLASTQAPEANFANGTEITRSLAEWEVERFRTDRAISKWANNVSAIDLTGRLKWFSSINQSDLEEPVWRCATHMFNHQTHHRGQLHVMLTAIGAEGPISDLIFAPKPETKKT